MDVGLLWRRVRQRGQRRTVTQGRNALVCYWKSKQEIELCGLLGKPASVYLLSVWRKRSETALLLLLPLGDGLIG